MNTYTKKLRGKAVLIALFTFLLTIGGALNSTAQLVKAADEVTTIFNKTSLPVRSQVDDVASSYSNSGRRTQSTHASTTVSKGNFPVSAQNHNKRGSAYKNTIEGSSDASFNLTEPDQRSIRNAIHSNTNPKRKSSEVVAGFERKTVDKTISTTKTGNFDYRPNSKEQPHTPDFIITRDRTAVPTSQRKMREGFDNAGFERRATTKTPEKGEIHTVPTKYGEIDVRTMEGTKHKPRRAVFTEPNSNSQVKINGEKFRKNELKQVRRKESHLTQKE